MKLIIWILSSITVIIACGYLFMSQKYEIDQLGENTGVGTVVLHKIDVESFRERHATREYMVIDVRTPEEYEMGALVADARLINFYDSDFKEQLNMLDKDQKYLIHCRSGVRSGKTLSIMKELGFTHVYDLEGGKLAWERAGYDLVSVRM